MIIGAFTTSIMASLLFAGFAHAGCVASFSGYLSTSTILANGRHGYFYINSEDEISFSTTTSLPSKTPIMAQFMACLPNRSGNPNEGNELVGRIYVSRYNKCISITDQSKPAGPYHPKLVSCEGTMPSYGEQFISKGGSIYWIGGSDIEGTYVQGGCGTLGYAAGAGGIPITETDKQIRISCGGNAFLLRPDLARSLPEDELEEQEAV